MLATCQAFATGARYILPFLYITLVSFAFSSALAHTSIIASLTHRACARLNASVSPCSFRYLTKSSILVVTFWHSGDGMGMIWLKK